jgi:mannose-6-phosphate isomerase-like protein (cupin superfamily)
MSSFVTINLKTFCDERGMLTFIEKELDFDIKRIFWITGSGISLRGGHRHYLTRQILVVVSGRVEVYVNDGYHEKYIDLNSPSKCLIVEPDDWHTMRFDKDSIMLVIASHEYDPLDYIDEPYLKRKNHD